MKKHPQLSSLAFTLLFAYNFSHAEADKNLKDAESANNKITLGFMVISANHIDQPFQKTTLIKENSATSSDATNSPLTTKALEMHF